MKKKQGKKGILAIKLDMEKENDRIDWGFFRDILSLIDNLKNSMMFYVLSIILSML